MKTLMSIAACALFLTACKDENPEMTKRFPDGESRILTDKDGNIYSVSHTSLDNYFVRPLR